ncbi:MAG: hypothetical protein RL006_1090 [Chloroflexota bacterium]|jgi:hypothetical protein
MSDKIKRVTPREIADMLINEEAYQSTLFVTAADHDAEIANLDAEITNLRTEVLERARLLSVGAEREAKLSAENESLRARVEELERVRGVAQSLINTASRLGWIAAATLRDDLRAALKEAKP